MSANTMKNLLTISTLCLGIATTLVACGDPKALTPGEVSTASLGGRDYADKLGGKFLSCSPRDSDYDGYTSCDVLMPNGSTKSLSCGYGDATGCKAK